MDAKSFKRLLPRDEDDAETARALVALGFPVLEPVMSQMLEWLKSNGSPVEAVMRDFFAALPRCPRCAGRSERTCVSA
jgi:hypothetical protein